MTDREMLELAAKAAGMEGMRYASPYTGMVKMLDPTRPETTGSIGPDWNPLADDGDALRLAVKLGFLVRVNLDDLFVRVICEESLTAPVHSEALGADPYASTRRAIVRAAAEIGRNMK